LDDQGLDLPDVAKNINYQGIVAASDLPALPSSIAPSYFLSQGNTGLLALPPVQTDFKAPPSAKETGKASPESVV
jgi:hypothetical protein